MKRPTQRDIAKIANVTHVTVSLALRGHRSIPKVTRERIEAIAKEIGYRPDAALSALMAYRRGVKPTQYQGTLAWINAYEHPENLALHFPQYYFGALERSAELGYKLEEFRLVDLERNFRRLSEILHARNIEGLLFPPQDQQRHITRASFDWENYFLIAFGFSLKQPKLDLVSHAMFESTRLAVRKLLSLGYRRIGFVDNHSNERSSQNFLAGYIIEQRRFPILDQVPIHVICGTTEGDAKQGLVNWIANQEPDSVISVGWEVANWFRGMKPDDRNGCAYAIMDVPGNNSEFSGINQNNHFIGRVAVDTLVSKIHSNDRGIPENPRHVLIGGRWVPGKTAPRIIGERL